MFIPSALLFLSCASEESVKVHNSNPTVTITSHSETEIFQAGYEILFQAQVQDDNDDTASLLVEWNTDQRTLCSAVSPTLDGATQCQATLAEGEQFVRVQVVDPEGAAGLDEVSITVEPTFAPTVDITSPTVQGLYYSDQLILFSATIQDEEDSPLELQYSWTSSIDGVLATTSDPSEDGNIEEYFYLSEGSHSLVLEVVDLSGKKTEKTILIQVRGPNTAPNCEIVAPQSGQIFSTEDTIIFEGSASDAEVDVSELAIQWHSDKDGDLGSGLVNSTGEITLSYGDLSPDVHTIQLTVQDEQDRICSDSVVLSVETRSAPQLTIDSPLDGAVIESGGLVQFVGSVQDQEDIPNDITITWESDIDGVFSQQGANSNGGLALNTSSLSVGLHSITITAVDSSGLSDSALLSLRINQIPTAPTVTFVDDSLDTADDIVVQASGSTDLDGDSITYQYAWYQNGNSTSHTGNVLSSAHTQKGEIWSVRVTPNDGYQDGTFGEATIAIGNTAPSVDSLTINATEATTTQTLSCSGVATDLDGDSLSEEYLWTNLNTGVAIGSLPTITLQPLSVSPGDSIQCAYSADDGTDTTTSSAVIGVINSDPSIDSLSLVPSIPYISETLTCLGEVSDDDLESITESYLWENQTTSAVLSTSSTLILSTVHASPNDVISCTLSAEDPSGSSVSQQVSATVGNLAPSIDSLSFNAESVSIGDTLTCISSETDPEGEIPTTDYEWTNTTTNTVIGTGASITLTSAMATGLDEISCTLTVSDSYGASDTESISIEVRETVPEFDVPASIIPNTGIGTQSTVNCTGIASDPDNTQVTLSYMWSVGNTTLGTSQSLSLFPSIIKPTDILTCTITATDGAGEQAESTASVMISNTGPEVQNTTIVPNTGILSNSALSCSGSVSDADQESLTPTYAWKNGNSIIGTGANITLNASMVQPSDSVTCVVSVTDGYGATAEESATVIIENTAPTLDSLSISPATAYNSSQLTCTPIATDIDNQSLITTYTWTNSTTNSNLGSDSTLQLDSNISTRNDEISCAVEISDPSGGTITGSTSVTLGNRAPSAPSVGVTPSNAYIDSELVCTPSGSIDPDNDAVSYQYSWMVNGVDSGETGNTFSAGFAAEEEVSCIVTPSDGLLEGNSGTNSVTISNSIPVITSLSLAPDPVYTDNELMASLIASDLDGDSLSYTYSWAVEGNTVQSGPLEILDSSFFLKGETVTLSVTADDGFQSSAALTESIVISNSVPLAPTVSMSPVEPIEQVDNLVCSITAAATDVDGDSLSYQFQWTVDGVAYTGATSTANTSTVSASETNSGEDWVCIVTPNDGEDDGSPASASTTIEADWAGTITFTTCGNSGRYGPSLSQCQGAYQNTTLEGLVSVTDGYQYWTVPSDGDYRIEIQGAGGGDGTDSTDTIAGKGAQIIGTFSLTKDTVLKILVGQKGGDAFVDSCSHVNRAAGGGGGTFVAYENDTPLIVAGGGNGDSWGSWNTDGVDALTTNTGTDGGSIYGRGGGGGGFVTNGVDYNGGLLYGKSFLNGGEGGDRYECNKGIGGFGGGGGAQYEGGGGGGYHGGKVVNTNDYSTSFPSYGAGSYNNGLNPSNTGGVNTGDGVVIIDKL